MKSYKKWQNDVDFINKIFPQLIEWSIWDLWGGRGMDPQEAQHMERLGRMIGFNKSWWNVLKRDSRHGADEFMTRLNSIATGTPAERADSTIKVLKLMSRNKGEFNQGKGVVANNSPLKQAYENLERIKRNVNPKGGYIDGDELRLMVMVLTNAHAGGHIPFNDLAELWSRITGIKERQVDKSAMQNAIQNHIQTPAQLLGSFFGISGGVFSSPGNAKEIRNASMSLLRKIDPEEYHRLIGGSPLINQPAPNQTPPPTQPQNTPNKSPNNPNQNPLDLSKMTPQEIDALEQRLKQQLAAVDAHKRNKGKHTP